MLKFINPSLVVTKRLQGIIEIILRGISIVLSLTCIAAASAYFGLLEELCSTIDTAAERNINAAIGSCKEFQYASSTFRAKMGLDQKSAAGWIIFLSIIVTIHQVLAFLQLFLHFKILHIKIPLLKTFWTLFFIIDIVAIVLFAFFYFCGAIAVAVLGGKNWKDLIDMYRDDGREYYITIADSAMKVYSATIAISVFAFFAMLLYIGTAVYFLVAKLLKKPTHGADILLLEEADAIVHVKSED